MSDEKPATKQAKTTTKPEQRTTVTVDHPKLGPALGILDDRRRSKQRFVLSFVWMATGLLGLYMGSGDLSHSDSLGLFWVGGGVVLIGYGIMELRTALIRLRRPVRLVMADAGIDVADGPGPIAWTELKEASLDIPGRQGEPIGVRVLVTDPAAFLAKHQVSWNEARHLRSTGWLQIKGITAMPLENLVDMLRERIPNAPRPIRRGAPGAADGSGAGRTNPASTAKAAAEAGGPRPKRRTSRH
jgi:hypothetical protein